MTIRNVQSESARIRANGETIVLTIEAGSALSNMVRLHGRRVMAIEVPAGWTAADLTFLSGSDPAVNMRTVYSDAGAEISLATAADRVTSVTGTNADALAPLDHLQVRSGTSGAPVNQLATRTLHLLVK